MPKIPLLVALMLSVLLAACGGDAPQATSPAADASTSPPEKPAAPAKLDAPPAVVATWRGEGAHIEFSTWELGCSGCEMTVEKRVGDIDGVTAVKADMATAVVTVDVADADERAAVIEQITKVLEQPPSGRRYEIIRAKP